MASEQGNVPGYFSSQSTGQVAGSVTPSPTPSKMGSSRNLILAEDKGSVFDLIRAKVEWTNRIAPWADADRRRAAA